MDKYENNTKHYNTPRPIPQRNKPSIIRKSVTKKSSLSNLPNLPLSKHISAPNNTPNGDRTHIHHHHHQQQRASTSKRGHSKSSKNSSRRDRNHTNTNNTNGHNSNHTSNNTSELQEIVANDFAQISESDDEHEHDHDHRIHINHHIKTKNRPSTAKTLPHIVDDRKYFKSNAKFKQKRKSTFDRTTMDRNTLDAVQGYRQSMSKGSGSHSFNHVVNNSMSTLTNSNYSISNNNLVDNSNEYQNQTQIQNQNQNQNPNQNINIPTAKHMMNPSQHQQRPQSHKFEYRPTKRRKSAEAKYDLNQLIEINDPTKPEIVYGLVINIQHKRMLIKYNNKQSGQEWFELNDPRINIVKYKMNLLCIW